MKNQLKLIFGITLVGVFSIGCEKDSSKPTTSQQVEQKTNPQIEPKGEFTFSCDIFQDGIVDHKKIERNYRIPYISWKNAPKGTKGMHMVMDDDKNHTYCNGQILWDIVTSSESGPVVFGRSFLMLPEEKNDGGNAAIELFALNCTEFEFRNMLKKAVNMESVYVASRAKFKEILETSGLSKMILGSTVVEYKIRSKLASPDKDAVILTVVPGTLRSQTVSFNISNNPKGGIWVEYKEFINDAFSKWHFVNKPKFNGNTVRIEDLHPSKKYKVRLVYKKNGPEEYSDEVVFTTPAE